MPGKKHLRGASAKEERQYEHIKKSARDQGATATGERK
jgi:hypothetical protein